MICLANMCYQQCTVHSYVQSKEHCHESLLTICIFVGILKLNIDLHGSPSY